MKHMLGPKTKTAIDQYLLTGVDIQPNAVDLRLERVFGLTHAVFEIDEDTKKHLPKIEIHPGSDDVWFLSPGQYEVIMQGIITVGDDEAGFVITRSSLNRNGIFITSGLYDSGYSGVMAGMLHCTRSMKIKKGTRIGQFLLFDAETLYKYAGAYGVSKEHDEKLYGKG